MKRLIRKKKKWKQDIGVENPAFTVTDNVIEKIDNDDAAKVGIQNIPMRTLKLTAKTCYDFAKLEEYPSTSLNMIFEETETHTMLEERTLLQLSKECHNVNDVKSLYEN